MRVVFKTASMFRSPTAVWLFLLYSIFFVIFSELPKLSLAFKISVALRHSWLEINGFPDNITYLYTRRNSVFIWALASPYAALGMSATASGMRRLLRWSGPSPDRTTWRSLNCITYITVYYLSFHLYLHFSSTTTYQIVLIIAFKKSWYSCRY